MRTDNQTMDKLVEELTWINKEMAALNSYLKADVQKNLDEVQNRVGQLSNQWEDIKAHGSDEDVSMVESKMYELINEVNAMIAEVSHE